LFDNKHVDIVEKCFASHERRYCTCSSIQFEKTRLSLFLTLNFSNEKCNEITWGKFT